MTVNTRALEAWPKTLTEGKTGRKTGLSMRLYVVASLATFLVLWMFSAEQYLFCPAIAVAALLVGGGRTTTYQFHPIDAVIGTIGILSLGAILWTEYRNVAIRSADVWLSALAISYSYRNASSEGREYLIRCLLGVWLLSVASYFVSQTAPGITSALGNLRMPVTNTVAVGFSTPSLIFDYTINRPIGFLLYANELALFGLMIVAARLYAYPIRRPLATLYVGLAVAFLVLSTSRSLILALIVVSIAFLVSRLTARQPSLASRMTWTGIICALPLVLLVAVTPNLTSDLQQQSAEVSAARYGASEELRETSYRVGIEIARENPISGVGGLPQLSNIQAGSHSLPISLWVRYGIPGLLLCLIFLGMLAFVGVRALFEREASVAWMGAMLILAAACSPTIQFDDDIFSLVGIVTVFSIVTTLPTRARVS